MGKKSRKKRERSISSRDAGTGFQPSEQLADNDRSSEESIQERLFQERIASTTALLGLYNTLDVAVSLSVSDLWPGNTGSPTKHIFAWCVLLSLPYTQDKKSISSYSDFETFLAALYDTWPEFPMLEDFGAVADWGQIRVRLGENFVPMFYGGCIERTPDYIEAFRITYAHVPKALAQMDLAVALQAHIIESMPQVRHTTGIESTPAHVEVPLSDFWLASRAILQGLGDDIIRWRERAGRGLETGLNTYKAPLTWNGFGDAMMRGAALPFLAVEAGGTWVPMSVRSAPGVVVDLWAKRKLPGVSTLTHNVLGEFIAQRFRNTVSGPLALVVGNRVCEDLPISCVMSDDCGVTLVAACDYTSVQRRSKAAKDVYTKLGRGFPIRFRRSANDEFTLSKDAFTGPSVDNLRILIVVTLEGTDSRSIDIPEKPARLLPLADFITILDCSGQVKLATDFWVFQ